MAVAGDLRPHLWQTKRLNARAGYDRVAYLSQPEVAFPRIDPEYAHLLLRIRLGNKAMGDHGGWRSDLSPETSSRIG